MSEQPVRQLSSRGWTGSGWGLTAMTLGWVVLTPALTYLVYFMSDRLPKRAMIEPEFTDEVRDLVPWIIAPMTFLVVAAGGAFVIAVITSRNGRRVISAVYFGVAMLIGAGIPACILLLAVVDAPRFG